MKIQASVTLSLWLIGCGNTAPAAPTDAGVDAGPADARPRCPESDGRGAAYDLLRSRFAFGSEPVSAAMGDAVRWTGTNGAMVRYASGSASAGLNGGAAPASLAGWSGAAETSAAHVQAYFVGMGLDACQIETASVVSSSDGDTVALERALDGVPVAESHAIAHFDSEDQTTFENFWWPAIPADVVAAARALDARLTDPAQLAAYQQQLPAEARGGGQVVIHHTNGASAAPFAAQATWQVYAAQRGSVRLFDAEGKPARTDW